MRRLLRAETQRNNTIRKITEDKILETKKLLQSKKRVELENHEQRIKRTIIQEAKENVWKKWMGKVPKSRPSQTSDKEELEETLKRVEKALEGWKNEERDRKEQEKRELERRNNYIEEKKDKENERIIREKEKPEKRKAIRKALGNAKMGS